MKEKVILIISIIIGSIVLLLVATYLLAFNSLKLNGDRIVYVNYDEEYKDEGATYKLFTDKSSSIITDSNVINGTIGNYRINYSINLLFFNITRTRLVYIVDKKAPVINLVGEKSVTICPNAEYIEEGYVAIDEHDGDITDRVKIEIGEGEVTYEVSDSSGNKEKVIRLINKKDEEAPVLSLKGNKKTYVSLKANYSDLGYTVVDNCDVNINVNVENTVDTSKEGTYRVTYEAIDSSSNSSKVEREVVVYRDDRVGIVYLTFDDGPSGTGSTEKILNILKNEDVKATFFVTGKGPDSLLKREFDEGHTIGLHTNSHDYYKLYKSVDAYYEDLNAVKSRVYNITGEYPTLLRFPGGSNNTVSITASGYRIMDTLTKDVLEKGYSYYDWNITSGDAGECTTSSCVYSNVVNRLSKNRINIVLMHDIKMFTANALQDIINYCKSNNYVFSTIDESTPLVRFK